MSRAVDRPAVENLPQPTGIADPGPLGLAAFAGTTFFLSAVNAGLAPGTIEAAVLGLALFYGGLAQLLAGMWEFTKGNTFGALAFSSYGAFWLSYWYLVDHVLNPKSGLISATAGDVAGGIGLYLLVWTIFTAYMCLPATRVSGVVLAVFVLLALTFFFLMLGAFTQTQLITRIGGWLGLLTAFTAWYGSLAGVTNATFKRTVLNVFPPRAATTSLTTGRAEVR
jgi:succinate-acetate transporter protein